MQACVLASFFLISLTAFFGTEDSFLFGTTVRCWTPYPHRISTVYKWPGAKIPGRPESSGLN